VKKERENEREKKTRKKVKERAPVKSEGRRRRREMGNMEGKNLPFGAVGTASPKEKLAGFFFLFLINFSKMYKLWVVR